MRQPEMRPDVRAFLDLMAAHPRPPMTAETIAGLRAQAPQGMAMLEPPVGALAVMRDGTLPGPHGGLPYRLFDARVERAPGPAVAFFHGGGFVIGCIETHASLCAELARQLDLPVVSIGYRLAPEDPFPAAPDDAEAAARWVAAGGPGLAVTELVLCGDSAGGNLALVSALALRDAPAAVPVGAVLALYPVTDRGREDGSRTAFGEGYGLDRSLTAFFMESYRPPERDWRAAPLLADLAGLPPLLLATAGLDPLRDQGRAFAAKAVTAGVPTTYLEFAGTIHGCLGYRGIVPSGQADLAQVTAAAKAMLARG